MIPVVAALMILTGGGTRAEVVVDGAMHHLGTAGEPEWQEFADDRPEARSLKVVFQASTNPTEATLFVRQRNVKLDWDVQLNGQSLGKLTLMDADLVHTLAVPKEALRTGENVLEIRPPLQGIDDIVVGEVVLDPRPRGEAVGRANINVRVGDAVTGKTFPCRFTIVDDRGVLASIVAEPDPRLAVRAGVVYAADGQAGFGVRPGRYTVIASRGFEYGVSSMDVTVTENQTTTLALALRREVPTPGLVACDPHVHTRTYSGHGDATIEERVVTLAGEGVELPVATDHDTLVDLGEKAKQLGLRTAFTPVIGDEVTTRRGHFNAFPFEPDASIPDSGIDYWPTLMKGIRSGSSGRVVVLNHPRDVHSGFRPFGEENFNPAVGEERQGVPFEFDAVEVINSGAMQSDPMRLVHDWFALWNHGQEITAVGSSDSHDVSRFIVGQGRTYLACRDDDPGAIDIGEACKSLRAGRALVSLGLLARIKLDDKFQAGDLATGLGDTLRVTVEVLGPSWTKADRVELFANGVKIQERAIVDVPGSVEKARIEWMLPRPARDVTLVAVASGPGVTAPYWPIPRPYQPTSKTWTPRVLGITNPIRVDADGDGSWSSPRNYAQYVMEIFGSEPSTLFRALAGFDEAVATQAAAFCLTGNRDVPDPDFAKALKSAPEMVRRGFAAFEDSTPRPGSARR